MFKSILMPVDGSDNSIKAVKLGADLAAKYGSRVMLLHVLLHDDLEDLRRMAEAEHMTEPPRHPLPAVYAGVTAEITATMREVDESGVPEHVLRKVGENIIASARQICREAGVPAVETAIVDGDPADTILAYAGDGGFDTIVMGSRGLSDLQAVVAGSVSHKVAHKATATCIAVK